MSEAEKYLKDGVDLTVFDLSKISIEDLEQLVLDTYNDAINISVKNNDLLHSVSKSFECCKEQNKCSKQCDDCKMVYNCF